MQKPAIEAFGFGLRLPLELIQLCLFCGLLSLRLAFEEIDHLQMGLGLLALNAGSRLALRLLLLHLCGVLDDFLDYFGLGEVLLEEVLLHVEGRV